MEKLINNIKDFVVPIIVLLIIASPFKSISFLFLICYLIYELLCRLVKPKINFNSLIILFILMLNVVFLIIGIGVEYLSNYFLFFIFISPVLLFITKDTYKIDNKKNNDSMYSKRHNTTKRVIESFLFIQILFSCIGIVYRLSSGVGFDSNFGDIVAGTFRIPFIYRPDASNMIFAFTMIIVLFLYKSVYKKNTNKFIEYLSYLIVFLASVNHLILAVFVSLAVVFSFKKPHYVIGSAFAITLLYFLFQPVNFYNMIDRVHKLTLIIHDPDSMAYLSLKGQYILNFFSDFKENLFRFLFVGVGAGNYSSRAALFFTGEYVSSFPFTAVSSYMQSNTFILWKELLAAPPFLSGAFNYPYNSIFTFIAELGLFTTIIIFTLFYQKIRSISYIKKEYVLFFIIFLLLAGMVDNYFEYYQSTFIFYYLWTRS